VTALPEQGASVAVQVPATSANLGPGFDALGIALDVHLVARAVPRAGGDVRVTSLGEGEGELPDDERNLAWRALVAYCGRVGQPVPDTSLELRSAIPLERGMGSSAAAAVAGAALGRALTGAGTDADVIGVATDLEGHPDNAAPAVLGGLVVCSDGRFVRLDPSDALQPVLCIPTARQATGEARALLPASVPLAEAAANGARVALVVAGLCGAAAFDPRAMTDVLHEPARLAAMAGSGALVAALRAAGVGACLSGAGPSVLAVIPRDDPAALAAVREAAGTDFTVRPSVWDRSGVVTLPPPAG
jgi:homoserine kinase